MELPTSFGTLPPVIDNQPTGSRRHKNRKRRAAVRSAVPASAPVRNTRSQTTAAVVPPASRTRARSSVSRIVQPTVSSRGKRHGTASSVEVRRNKRQLRCITKQVRQLEQEVHQAMAVMDAETDKLLNYRQLTCNPKYKKNWIISSANEFGRIANGVGGHIKIKVVHTDFVLC